MIGDGLLQDALVDPLVMAAQKDQIFLPGKLAGHLLVKDLPLRVQVDDARGRPFRLYGADRAVYGLRLHHHAGASPVGIVIHTALALLLREIADIDRGQGKDPSRDRAARDARIHPGLYHLRK